VDVESPQARAHVEIAERCFAPAERAEMASHSADLQGDRFLEYWTLKESFLKALGLGLSYPPSSICFSLGPDGIRIVAPSELNEPTEAWRFESWLHEDQYRIALAMRSEGRNVPIVMSPWTGGFGR
jgi:4'-phosphopantetheinyl transferase